MKVNKYNNFYLNSNQIPWENLEQISEYDSIIKDLNINTIPVIIFNIDGIISIKEF